MGDAFKAEVDETLEYVSRLFIASGTDLVDLKDVKILNKRFQMLRARLDDSEEMKITLESAKLSLGNLKIIFYEMEDLLEKSLYHVMDLKSDNKLVITNHTAVFFRDLSMKAGLLLRKLETAETEWLAEYEKLERQPGVLSRSTLLPESISAIGRKKDIERITGLLLSEPAAGKRVQVIAIMGMGGLGKTKLASSVFHSAHVQDYFDKRIWVRVSEDSDLNRMTSAMLDALGLEHDPHQELNLLEKRLCNHLKGKKALIVLDDIWKVKNLSDKAWYNLKKTFTISKETKVIVTRSVTEFLDTEIVADEIYQLLPLNDDDCFEVFKHHAFSGMEFKMSDILLQLGKEISKKCRGVPLIARTLGRLLRCHDDAEKWVDVLNNSHIWVDCTDLLPILRLSYQYLTPFLKRCFRYCSMFPKGYQFKRNQLINMWMAHGFIHQTEPEENQEEERAEKYMNDLISMSLFEEDERDETMFTVHDLIHDLSRDVSREEWSSVQFNVSNGQRYDGFQHFSIICTKYPQKHVRKNSKVRSLLIFNSTLELPDVQDLCRKMEQLRVLDLSHSELPPILPEHIGSLKHLRFLSLEGNAITELPKSLKNLHFLETLNLNGTDIKIFPDFICSLKRLRYLGLRGTPIKCLPESLGLLDQLLTLDLDFCEIDHLPYSISNMSSLRHLICADSVIFPLNIRKLTHLPLVKEITDTDATTGISPCNRQRIKVLSLILNDGLTFEKPEDPFKTLEEHPNIKQLRMEGFGGRSLPSQLIDHLPHLNRLDLIGCACLTSLSFENIPCLRHLNIDSATSLTNILFLNQQRSKVKCQSDINQSHSCVTLSVVDCPNLLSISSSTYSGAVTCLKITRCPLLSSACLGMIPSLLHLSIAESCEDISSNFSSGKFPQLGTLELKDLPNWSSWRGPGLGEFPKLKNLSIIDCPNVTSFSGFHLKALKVMKIFGCPQLPVLYLGQLSSLRHLHIKDSDNDIPKEFSGAGFQQLETLKLENLHSWISWRGPQERQCLNLSKIYIINCTKVRSFSFAYLHNINELYLESCQCLTLDYQTAKLLRIEKLYICDIHERKLVVKGYDNLPYQFKRLSVARSPNFRNVRHTIIKGCTQLKLVSMEDLPPLLETIQVHDCKEITDLSLDSQVALKYLSIINCSRLSTVTCGSSILRFLEINTPFELVFCCHGNLKEVEYLHVSECVLMLTDRNVILSSLRVMEIEATSSPMNDLNLAIPNSVKYQFPQQRYGGRLASCNFHGLRDARVIFRRGCNFIDTERLPSTLKVLEIIGCRELNNFPFDRLDHLKELRIIGCSSSFGFNFMNSLALTPIVLEISGSFDYCFDLEFPRDKLNIRHLKLKDMQFLYEINLPSKLRVLEIIRCSKLTNVSFHSLACLEELSIVECSWPPGFNFVDTLPSTLRKLEVSGSNKNSFELELSLERLNIQHLNLKAIPINAKMLPSTLKVLEITRCFNFTDFSFGNLQQLEEMRIIECSSPIGLTFLDSLPSTMKVLEIAGSFKCDSRLKLLLKGSNIQHLKLRDMPSFHKMSFPSTLKMLEIIQCPIDNFKFSRPGRLEELRIVECSRPDGLDSLRLCESTIRKLEIAGSFDNSFGVQFSRDRLNIQHLKLVAISSIYVESLPSALKTLEIIRCFSLESISFDDLRSLEKLRIIKCPFLCGVKFMSSLPSTLRILEFSGPFEPNFALEFPRDGLNIQHLVVKDMLFYVDRLPSTLTVLEVIRCFISNDFSARDLDLLEELRLIECSWSNGFAFKDSLPSALKVIEIAGSSNDNFELRLSLQRSNVQHLKLKDMPTLCFANNFVPASLQKLSLLRCPYLEEWCRQNSHRLTNIQIVYGEEEGFRPHSTCSLLPSYEDFEGFFTRVAFLLHLREEKED